MISTTRSSPISATTKSRGPDALLARAAKRPLFDCRMCGHCVLSSAGMPCQMNCHYPTVRGHLAQGGLARRSAGCLAIA